MRACLAAGRGGPASPRDQVGRACPMSPHRLQVVRSSVVTGVSETGVSKTGVAQTGVAQAGVAQTGVAQTGAVAVAETVGRSGADGGDGRRRVQADGADDGRSLAVGDADRLTHGRHDRVDGGVGVRLVAAVGEVAAEPVALNGGRVVGRRAQKGGGRGGGQAGEQHKLTGREGAGEAQTAVTNSGDGTFWHGDTPASFKLKLTPWCIQSFPKRGGQCETNFPPSLNKFPGEIKSNVNE